MGSLFCCHVGARHAPPSTSPRTPRRRYAAGPGFPAPTTKKKPEI